MFEGEQAKFALKRIGDYELNYGYFMQLWCDDKILRRKAALDHVLRIIKQRQKYIKREDIQEQLQLKAKQLQITELEFADLRQRALELGVRDLANVLE